MFSGKYLLCLPMQINETKVIRSNSSPTGWSKNTFKNIVYKNAYQAADSVIVNSIEFSK